MQIHEITEGILKGVKDAPPARPQAGFVKNAAEYFANKILNKAGIPPSQQGQYDPTGHMAASMGKGAATLRRQELDIANKLSNEYLRKKSLNDRPFATTPTHQDIVNAVDVANKGSYRDLNIDNNAVASAIEKNIQLSKTSRTKTSTAPAPGSFASWQSGPTASNTQYSEPVQVGTSVDDAYVKGPQGWVSAKNKRTPAPDNMIPMLDKILAAQGPTK